jgi:L-threonylcarbamoyladenylate synthase
MIPRIVSDDQDDLGRLVERALETGQTLVFPTDTVYGIGGNPWNDDVLERVRQLKGRSAGSPFSLHLSSVDQIERYAVLSKHDREVIERILPGPFTLLLRATSNAPPSSVSQGVVGIRVPSHRFFAVTLGSLRRPVFASSVNRGGEIPLESIEEIAACFPSVDLLIEGSIGGRESAILDLTGALPRLVRGSLPEGLLDETPS